MFGEVQIAEVPETSPVAHHRPAVDIQVQPRHYEVEPSPFRVQVLNQQRLKQQFEDADVASDGKTDPDGLDWVFWHKVDVLQLPCATPVKNRKWKYEEERYENVSKCQESIAEGHRNQNTATKTVTTASSIFQRLFYETALYDDKPTRGRSCRMVNLQTGQFTDSQQLILLILHIINDKYVQNSLWLQFLVISYEKS